MKKLSMLGRAGAILAIIGLTASANAQLITLSAGGFTINANGYTADTIFTQAPGARQVVPGPAGKLEDTWGIFQITSILSGATTVFADNAGVEYWGFIYDSYDTGAPGVVGDLQVFTATGLRLDVYKKTVADVGDAAWQTVYNQGTGGRTGLSTYTGITDGTLVLSTALSGTMTSTFQGTSLANGHTTASGNLGITFNNLLSNPPGTAITNLQFTLGGLTSNVPADWTVKFDGPVSGVVVPVPEPSTYGMIAAGALLGLVAFRRIKVRAQAV